MSRALPGVIGASRGIRTAADPSGAEMDANRKRRSRLGARGGIASPERGDSGRMTNPADLSTLQALGRGLCPRCRSGRIFAGRLRMNTRCPVCNERFERAPGYFVGAMYVSYAISIVVLGVLFAILRFGVVPSWPLERVLIVALAAYLLFVAPIFRWSRIIWIYLGERFAW